MPRELSIVTLARRELLAQGGRLITEAQRQLEGQGHVATGNLYRSFAIEPQRGRAIELIITMADYGQRVNDGVPAAVVRGWLNDPAARRKYIDGLATWAVHIRPGLSGKRLYDFVYAVAAKAATTGHPTPGAKRFSRNGQRTDFLGDAVFLTQDSEFIAALRDGLASSDFILPNFRK